MSWFDSSFTFAKSALSQAQKSIDKVLDIKDDLPANTAEISHEQTHTPVAASKPVEHSSSTKSQPQAKPTSSHLTPQQSSKLSQSSESNKVNSSSSAAKGASRSTNTQHSNSSFGGFNSTWGGLDSFWSSPTVDNNSSSKKKEGKKTVSSGNDSSKKKTASVTSWLTPSNDDNKGAQDGQSAKSAEMGVTLESQPPPPCHSSPALTSTPVEAGKKKKKLSKAAAAGGVESEPPAASTPSSSTSPTIEKEREEKKADSFFHPATSMSPVPAPTTPREESLSPLPPPELSSTSAAATAADSNKGQALISSSSDDSPPGPVATSGREKASESPSELDSSVAVSPLLPDSCVAANLKGNREGSSNISPVPDSALTSDQQQGISLSPLPDSAVTLDQQKGDSLSPIPDSKESNSVPSPVPDSAAGITATDQSNHGSRDLLSPISTDSRSPSSMAEQGNSLSPLLPESNDLVSVSPNKSVVDGGAEATDGTAEGGGGPEVVGGVAETGGMAETEDASTGIDGKRKIDGGSEGALPDIVSVNGGAGVGSEGRTKAAPSSSPAVLEGHTGRSPSSLLDTRTSSPGTGNTDYVATVGGNTDTTTVPDYQEMEKLKKELAEARRILEVREEKIVSMSHEIIGLMEANQALQSEVGVAEDSHQSSVDDMREEFTKRLGISEKKLQAVIKEKDSLKKQLSAIQNERSHAKHSETEELQRILKEKEEQVTQLMEEGEKLSKQELQSNGIIKKLRQKERQNDQLLTAQRQQIQDLENKVKNMKDQLKKKDETERKYQESLAQLNTIAEQQAKEMTSLKSEKEGLLEKVRSLQANLDNSYKELADLQKTNAVTQNEAASAAATAEKSKQEELKAILDQQKASFLKEKEVLIVQIEELRMSVSRAEQQLAWREEHMKLEVADVQKRLQEAEDRNQELTSTVSQATKPLLRQIENLQAAHATQSNNWEKVENNLTQRLVDAQTQLNVTLEKERSAVEKEMTFKSKIGTMESQLSNLRQEKSQLLATVELERAKLETLEESQHRETAKLEGLRASFQQSLDELRKEKEMLERQLEYERVRVEAESRKACLESQEKERLRLQLANSLSSLNRSISHQSSNGSQNDILEKSLAGRESMSEYSLHTNSQTAMPGSASALEHLQSLLKQKEGELANAQNLASSLERSRAAMAEDLAKISSHNNILSEEVEKIPLLQQELKEVRQKHEAMLQMYGEKAEEAEELKLDIQDLKMMYRQQIDELVSGSRRR